MPLTTSEQEQIFDHVSRLIRLFGEDRIEPPEKRPVDITSTDVDKYLATLDPQIAQLYKLVQDIVFSAADTSGDEFQIAAEALDVVHKYARRYKDMVDFHPFP